MAHEPRPLITRLLDRVAVDDRGCWLWTGPLRPNGYVRINRGRRAEGGIYIHRAAYECLVGPIPDGLTIDHLCRVRHCINPDHLEPVTRGENVLRGEGPLAVYARATHCVNGHPFNAVDTSITTRGGRRCRSCGRAQAAAARQRRATS